MCQRRPIASSLDVVCRVQKCEENKDKISRLWCIGSSGTLMHSSRDLKTLFCEVTDPSCGSQIRRGHWKQDKELCGHL